MTRRRFLQAAATGMAAASLPSLGGCSPSGDSGTVTLFTSGTIYLDAGTSARNLLVRDGTVAAFDVDPAAWPGATVVDLGGGAAYPGFTDSHMHLVETGTMMVVGGQMEAVDGPGVVRGLQAIETTHPGAKALLGFGLHPQDYDAWSLADLAAIDAAYPDRVIIVFDRLGHNCVVNGFAMRKFDVEHRPVPHGGTVVRQDGKPTGMFREAAMSLVATNAFAEFDDASVKAGTERLAASWARRGYTGLVDLMGATGLQLMRPHLLRELEQEGKLPLRVHFCHTILSLPDVDVAATHAGKDTDLVRFVGGKIFVDGAFAGGQAWTSWPHLSPAGSHGVPQITTDDAVAPELNLNRIVGRAEELGLHMHYHAQGDLAIKAVLDALSRVLDATGRLRGTHTLIHLAYPTPELVRYLLAVNARAGGQHVVATTQPGFWEVEADTVQYYGDRALEAYPLRMLVESGVSVGISTDFAVSPPDEVNPTRIIWVAATGGTFAGSHPAVSVQDVLHGLTVGSARTTGQGDVGMLRPGYKADLVVYETDLFGVDPADFTSAYPAVRSTWLGGRKVS